MREIKFRVWDGKIGCFIKLCETNILKDNVIGSNLSSVVIEQYTGLKDKNGVEICEGDLIDGFDGIVKMRVDFSLDDCAFIANSYSSRGKAMLNQDYCMNFIVIGNIHQNPELLK